MAEKEIVWKNIKTLYSFEYEKGGGYELRIGKWSVDGKEGQMVLERREWWAANTGERRDGKQKGLNKNDLSSVFGMANEISKIMGFTLPKEPAGSTQPQINEPIKNDAINQPVKQAQNRF